ncbi:MAG: DHH family phosphoesterase [Nanopusillaceae archaeon]
MFDKVSKEITKLNDVLIISDDDLDGIFSAKLMSIILSKLRIKHKIIFRRRNNTKKNIFSNINEKEVILLDLALKENVLKNISKDKKLIYIDHHYRYIPEDLTENVIFFDYKALYNEDLCTTCIVYRIGKHLFEDFSKYSIIALMGMIGDVSYDTVVLNDFKREYKNLLKEKLPIISLYYFFTLISSLDPEDLLDIDFDKDIVFILNKIKEKKIYKKLNLFFRKILDFKIIYKDENLILIESKKPSLLSTFLSPFYNDKIVVAITSSKKFIFKRKTIKISLRTAREDIDLGLIAKEFTENYGISGGGHKKAAGAIIKTEDIERFIEFIKKRL